MVTTSWTASALAAYLSAGEPHVTAPDQTGSQRADVGIRRPDHVGATDRLIGTARVEEQHSGPRIVTVLHSDDTAIERARRAIQRRLEA